MDIQWINDWVDRHGSNWAGIPNILDWSLNLGLSDQTRSSFDAGSASPFPLPLLAFICQSVVVCSCIASDGHR